LGLPLWPNRARIPGMSTTTFAERLKALREAANLTQAQLAERSGLNQFGVAKLEQGVREPAWATVQALAKALGVDCLAFTIEDPDATPAEKRGPGRPPKAAAAPAAPPAPPAAEPPAKGRGGKKPRRKKS
jgi:transcriptional regulator with XRE-family HTH domain